MQRRYALVLLLLLGAAAAAVNLPVAAGSDAAFALFRACLWLATLHALWGAPKRPERATGAALGVIACFALAAHVDFGRLHGGGRALHHHELYNYYIGSKYFPELGYEGHYLATHRALVENDPTLHGEIELVKNLRTYQLEGRLVSLQRSESVSARFTAERWREFQADVSFFQSVIPRDTWPFLLVDHGYNATPFWTLLGRAFSTRVHLSRGALGFLASLDVALLAAAFALATSSFGRRAALLAAIFYLSSFYGAFEFTGGAFLRQVWFAGVVGWAACWRRGRHTAAGLCLAAAALDRVFPLLLALAPAALLVREAVLHRALHRGVARQLAACGAAVLALVLATGTGAWADCIEHLRAHNRWFFLNQISLRSLFLLDPASTWHLVRGGWDDSVWLRERQGLDAATQGALLALRLVLVGLVAARCARRADPWSSLGLAAFLPFVLLYPANYYYTLLALPLLCLAHDRALALAVVAGQAACWLLRACLEPPLYLELLNWGASLVLLLTLTAFLGRDLARAWRGAPAERRFARSALALALLAMAAGWGWDAARRARRPRALELDLVASQVRAEPPARASNLQLAAFGSAWSRNDHVFVAAAESRASATIALDAPASARYDLRVELTTAAPFGRVACALDGAPPFAAADLRSPVPGVCALTTSVELAQGRHALELRGEGEGPAGAGCGFGIDRVVLAPALGRDSSAAARDRALAWVLAHPADLFDGGRKDLCAELIALERLLDEPALASEHARLRAEALRRLAALNACPGDWALAPEMELLAAAGCAARRLGGELRVPAPARADIEAFGRGAYNERAPVPPLAVRAWLARLDGETLAPADLAGGALSLADASLELLAHAPRDPRAAKQASDMAQEALALTDLGRAPAPELPLSRADLARRLDDALSACAAGGEVLSAARLLCAVSALGLSAEVPARAAGLALLRAQQLADGSFGRTDPAAPNPEREAVLAGLLALAAQR